MRTKPLLDAMRLWLEQRHTELPRKSPLAEAVGYPLNQWEGLTRFVRALPSGRPSAGPVGRRIEGWKEQSCENVR